MTATSLFCGHCSFFCFLGPQPAPPPSAETARLRLPAIHAFVSGLSFAAPGGDPQQREQCLACGYASLPRSRPPSTKKKLIFEQKNAIFYGIKISWRKHPGVKPHLPHWWQKKCGPPGGGGLEGLNTGEVRGTSRRATQDTVQKNLLKNAPPWGGGWTRRGGVGQGKRSEDHYQKLLEV